jgi:thioesterase domain-containing protein
VDGVSTPFGSVEEMASAYLAEIRAVQPSGPYFLGGYCGGGLIAYQMAQELLAAGEQVALLALIDSPSPGRPPPPSRLRRWSRTLVEEDAGRLLRRAGAKWRRDLGAARRWAAIRFHLVRGEAVPHELRDAWLTDRYVRTAARYRVRPYPGRLSVFRARDATPGWPGDRGWEQVAAGGLVVEEVPGDHNSLTQEPHVQVLGARLEAALCEAEAIVARAPRP